MSQIKTQISAICYFVFQISNTQLYMSTIHVKVI